LSLSAVGCDGVVSRVNRGCNGDLVHQPCESNTFNNPIKHRAAGEVAQYLSGESSASHSRLNNCNCVCHTRISDWIRSTGGNALQDGFGDSALLLIRQRRKHRQTDRTRVVLFAFRKLAGLESQAPKVRLQMHRDIMHVDPNPGRSQSVKHKSAIGDLNAVQVQSGSSFRCANGPNDTSIFKGGVVPICKFVPP
jgi:hypothetical protein